MNERIRELADQAEKYADDNFRGEPTWSEAFESRFAELIVRECVDIVASRPYIDDGNWMHPSTMIRKHFGVEEDDQEDTDSACPLCGEDGGTTCGMPGCQY